MVTLIRIVSGPFLWGVVFSLVYAIHGTGCALDWTSVDTPLGSLHHLALLGAWLLGIAAHVGLFALVPRGEERGIRIARIGLWVGLAATVYTLFPVAVTSSCA
jgi:hypothetical protein